MFAEDFFEQIVENGILPIKNNFGDFLVLIVCMVISIALWLLPFVMLFLPLYYEIFVDFIKGKIND